MLTFTQTYLTYPDEKGWWWYTDGQSITAMYVDPDTDTIREMTGGAVPPKMRISSLRGHWQKAILPGNAVVTIQPPK